MSDFNNSSPAEHQDVGAESSDTDMSPEAKARRKFLEISGKVAVYTPPVMLGLMAPSMQAIANSAGGGGGGRPLPKGNNGVGNGSDALPPGLQNNGRSDLDNDDNGGTPGNPQNRGRRNGGG